MKYSILLFILGICVSNSLVGQISCDSLMIFKKGYHFQMSHYGQFERLKTIDEEVLEVKHDTGMVTSTIRVISKRKEIGDGDTAYTQIRCRDGKIIYSFWDLLGRHTSTEWAILEDATFREKLGFGPFPSDQDSCAVVISNSDVEIPLILKVGQKLPDKVLKSAIVIKGKERVPVQYKMTNRKVKEMKRLTIASDTFDCYVITYKVNIANEVLSSLESIAKTGRILNKIFYNNNQGFGSGFSYEDVNYWFELWISKGQIVKLKKIENSKTRLNESSLTKLEMIFN